jgi:hypothetical protein
MPARMAPQEQLLLIDWRYSLLAGDNSDLGEVAESEHALKFVISVQPSYARQGTVESESDTATEHWLSNP